MRSLVLGAGGMLGTALVREITSRSWPLLSRTKAEADIRDQALVARQAREFAPDVIFNCAAFTDVDGCETEIDLAFEINGRAVLGLVEVASELG